MDSDIDNVGLCLCQTNAYLRTLQTTVVSCTKLIPVSTSQPQPDAQPTKSKSRTRGPVGGGNSDSKASNAHASAALNASTPADGDGASAAAAATPGTGVQPVGGFEVFLTETPFFPESGGQPCDLGQLIVLAEDGTAAASTPPVNVTAVMWKEGALCHVTDAPLPPGCRVEARVDWQRRYDHMQQHTGQHVLSAVADQLLGADTASWELHPLDPETHGSGDYGCVAVDLTIPAITGEQLLDLEARVNEELRALRPVTPLTLDPRVAEDLQRMEGLRGNPEFRGSLPPPEKVKGSKLRLVCVEGLDINACGGTHVRSTGEVQLIKVVGAERTRGQTRVRFMCGGRALAALAGCLGREAALTAKLTCAPARHAEMVELLLRDRREGVKARKLLAGELAGHLGRALALEEPQPQPAPTVARDSAAEAAQAPYAPDGDPNCAAATTAAEACSGSSTGCPRWAVLHRPASDLDFLSLVATAALEASPDLQLLLLTADGLEPGGNPPAGKPGVEDSTEVTFLVAGKQPEAVRAVGAQVAEALGGRGGGRPGRYQGKATGLFRLTAARAAFLEAVEKAGLATGP